MPFTTIAYSESQDSATLARIAALADPHVTVNGDDVTVPEGLDQLLGFFFLGPNFTLGRLDSPQLRRFAPFDVEPADVAAEPASPSALHDFFETPTALKENEILEAWMAEDAAGASRVTAIVWLGDGPVAPVTGDIRTIRATNATTLVANAWTNGALTLGSTLPAGRFQLVGARAQSAGLQAFRFVPQRESIRPGAIGYDADGDLESPRFRNGRAGSWFEFAHNALPTADFLSNSADTAQVLHLDLIQVS